MDQLGLGKTAPLARKPAPQAKGSGRQAQATAHASSTAQPRTYITPTGKIKLFGTVELKRPLDTLPGWLDVLSRNKADPIFQPERYFNKKTNWESFKKSAAGKSPMDQLRFVNSFWNAWPYHEDIANWGKQDYWAIPAQFLTKSGDCEDYAIVKYFTLKELGFDPEKMRIVVLKDTIRNLAHAVLVVYLGNDAYVLDNLSNTVLSHQRLSNYSPQYSVNENGRWAHLKGK